MIFSLFRYFQKNNQISIRNLKENIKKFSESNSFLLKQKREYS